MFGSGDMSVWVYGMVEMNSHSITTVPVYGGAKSFIKTEIRSRKHNNCDNVI